MPAVYVDTREIPLDELSHFEGNAKRGDVDAILVSLRRNGQYRSLVVRQVVNGPLVVLAGNHTMRALKAHGPGKCQYADDETTPCGMCADDSWDGTTARCEIVVCDDSDARRINLADNKLAEMGGYDNDALAELLSYMDGDYEGTGYTDDDVLALITPSDIDLLADDDGPTDAEAGENPSLADRFLIPPFDVLDARQGWWRTRKRHWLSLGMRSEVGRGDNLVFEGMAKADPKYYDKKRAVEQAIGRPLTSAEFEADHYVRPDDAVASGTSVFDPVVCELAYRWFCPPNGSILDPFAGGSVRGIVAGILGRQYRGNDLRAEQVESNREQADEFAARRLLGATVKMPAPEAVVDDPTDLTPIEEHGGHLVKRDDLFTIDGSAGGKVRSCLALATRPGVVGLVTAGSRQSPQVNIVATIARRLGLPCRVHVPKAKGPLTPELAAARDAGAEIVEHTPGHNTVIIARAREDAAERGWMEIPFGMECSTAVTATGAQATNIPTDTRRIVIPVGSGMSLAGVLSGTELAGLGHIPILGVAVGADPTARLDKYAPGWRDRVTLVHSDLDYHDHPAHTRLGDLHLDPVYEAKCLPFLEDGDLLWVVGRRGSLARPHASTQPVPQWTAGDSVDWVTTLEPNSADMVFTCPPYYDLEEYSDNPADLSSMSYDEFDEAYARIIAGVAKALRPNRFAVFVTGDARDNRGALHDLRGSTIRAAVAAGLTYASGAVLVSPIGTAAVMAGRTFAGTRGLARTHQDVLVFCKGNRAEATKACGDVDVHLPEGVDDAFAEVEEAAEAA
ncbi:pyridoxal-phosphate dependent enzyme [Streptomyces scabiei]|uniref:pyridoxal-phosphate dependent enzyme n=1 Tax=Streptomyces scabiei TaxID=1930 RepID=UPI0029A52772|nr:pyridoxal-phosphate dependent enzyme [Streptomyces scabiei]MDX3124930.1 pyridoxal-phosphate dependent enzyme [Streptomyces scabiei]MDX3201850.1 pyridoxal-phosphate dependent enzyme [Streptomyces scabiei]MDX3223111.1 pyridoxal-phosphate dependent enzyme [Streptomyces scabiei]